MSECDPGVCDRCQLARQSVAFRSYDAVGVKLCLRCRLALMRGDYERFVDEDEKGRD